MNIFQGYFIAKSKFSQKSTHPITQYCHSSQKSSLLVSMRVDAFKMIHLHLAFWRHTFPFHQTNLPFFAVGQNKMTFLGVSLASPPCSLAVGASCLVTIDVFLTLPLSDLEFEVSEPKYLEVKNLNLILTAREFKKPFL
jgi:hypothetical protein